MQILDKWNKVIAWRYFLINEANRCFCVWKCECSCTSIEHQLFSPNCKIMSKEHYNNAGFRSTLPPILKQNVKTNVFVLTIIFMATYWKIALLIGKVYTNMHKYKI